MAFPDDSAYAERTPGRHSPHGHMRGSGRWHARARTGFELMLLWALAGRRKLSVVAAALSVVVLPQAGCRFVRRERGSPLR